ncbi:MAG: helix-turn-helix domain-containing protein [Treponema sp.]|nr:helix-turn-helix domain-containing protein [Treponema sp.]MCL2237536.1 helix-turn-helix domain-containing protein [Treponema sp.]
MSKLNIIQRRELEPLMLKAEKLAKHYEKATNYAACVLGSDWDTFHAQMKLSGMGGKNFACNQCNNPQCKNLHMEAVNKARENGGSYIYLCHNDYVFWTSPFYSGERMAGSLLSGTMRNEHFAGNHERIEALAHILLLCANRISTMSFVQKNAASLNSIVKKIENPGEPISDENSQNQVKRENYTCPLDMERILLACLRRGDNTEGQKILVKLLKIIYLEVRSNFHADHVMTALRLKAMELAVLLSRAAADPKDIMDNTSLEATNKNLIRIEESRDFDEIREILCAITERMSGMIFSFHGVRHFSALRKAQRYIWKNYTRKISLKEIADASGLSAPYFSTVFKDEMGENLSNYLNRLRVEKAAAMLVTTNLPINEIAFACGFEDQSWFSKIFKGNTGFTPGKYREIGIHAGGDNP